MKYMLIYYNRKLKKYGIIRNMPNLKCFNHLQDLTDFTSKFQNENDLKNYLIKNNLLDKRYNNFDLGIIAKQNNNQANLIRFGITYQEDLPYIDELFIKDYFQRNISDITFLEYFIDNYYDYLKNTNFFKEEIQYLKTSYDYLLNAKYLQEDTSKYLDIFLNHYMYRKKNNKYIRNKNQIRELGMFIHSYEKNIHPNDEINIEEINYEIANYNAILKEANITLEDRIAYDNKINNLEKLLRKRM